MIRHPVSSSNIQSIGYDQLNMVLEVAFHSGGIYQYMRIPSMVYQNLMQSGSKGEYFHRHIKDRYRWRKMR
ncbi:KTSC domain-containing protein [Edwardsiella tarda]|uniref:KTSC domain-containing protein n=1 Tax=Edwardsiella tarda TaxID=636 RepID=UPI003D2EE0AF